MTKVGQIAQRALAQRAKDDEEIDKLKFSLMVNAMKDRRSIQLQRERDKKSFARSLLLARQKKIDDRLFKEQVDAQPIPDRDNDFWKNVVRTIPKSIVSADSPYRQSDYRFRRKDVDVLKIMRGERETAQKYQTRRETRTKAFQDILSKFKEQKHRLQRYSPTFHGLTGARSKRPLTPLEKAQDVSNYHRRVKQEFEMLGWKGTMEAIIRLAPDPFGYGKRFSGGVGIRQNKAQPSRQQLQRIIDEKTKELGSDHPEVIGLKEKVKDPKYKPGAPIIDKETGMPGTRVFSVPDYFKLSLVKGIERIIKPVTLADEQQTGMSKRDGIKSIKNWGAKVSRDIEKANIPDADRAFLEYYIKKRFGNIARHRIAVAKGEISSVDLAGGIDELKESIPKVRGDIKKLEESILKETNEKNRETQEKQLKNVHRELKTQKKQLENMYRELSDTRTMPYHEFIREYNDRIESTDKIGRFAETKSNQAAEKFMSELLGDVEGKRKSLRDFFKGNIVRDLFPKTFKKADKWQPDFTYVR